MERQTAFIGAVLSFIGAILIFVNTVVVASYGSSIILSSYAASSIDKLMASKSEPWYRIAFGLSSAVEGALILFWLLVSVVILLLAASMFLVRVPQMQGAIVLLLSIISLFAGGGFIIGSILGIVGGSLALQYSKPFGETFFGRLIGIARFNSKTFEFIKQNPKLLGEGVALLILINFLTGLGSSLYLFNVDKILHSSTETSTRILLLGEPLFDITILGLPIIFIGLAIVKWIFLSFTIYVIGSRLLGTETKFDDVARLTAFAYTPVILQVFLPWVFANEPYLTTHWPSTLILITNLWMILVLMVAVRELFEITTTRALGILLLAGSIYWVSIYKFFLPMVFAPNPIPGILIDIAPKEFVLALVSLAVVLSYLLGTFKKY
ncbi:MAG: YIP1 family protein [Candidatus Bathyarchaeia archaeon]